MRDWKAELLDHARRNLPVVAIAGDNGPRQPPPTPEQLAEYHEAERARLLAQWVAAGHPPEKFGYYVAPSMP